MAGIDKIYGNQTDYYMFRNWLEENNKDLLEGLYPEFGCGEENRPIAMYGEKEDAWLYINCPLKFIKENIEFMYGSSLKKLLRKTNKKYSKTYRKRIYG